MRSTSARADAASVASSSRSTTLPDAGFPDREPELPKRPLDRLALRIEDPCLRTHEHRRLHRCTTSGSATYSANPIPVTRSKAST